MQIDTPFKYNPGVLGDDELVRSFVVRHRCLDLILETLRENGGSNSSNRHLLVVGPRGIGKTMLVRRVAAEVRSNPEYVEAWFPVVFGEESYQVSSSGEFWLEALIHLIDDEGGPEWVRTLDELRGEHNDARLRERALAQLLDFSDAKGKYLLLIVENLNMLCDQMSAEAAWELRHTLLNEPRIMLLGTATSRFDAIADSDQAWFELFGIHELKPLGRAESRSLWRAVADQDLKPGQVRAMRILTGGNPRLLTVLAGFAANRSFHELMEQLVHLIDDHTEYFKGHLDALPPKERKVFVALLEHWNPVSAADLAHATRMGVNEVSALLNRLGSRGAVEVVEKRPRRKLYQAAERLYNIYYLMRRRGQPADRVRAAVSFMVTFYGSRQLAATIADLAREACTLPTGKIEDHYLAYRELSRRVSPAVLHRALDRTPEEFFGRDDAPESIRQLPLSAKLTAIRERVEILLDSKEWSAAERALGEAIRIDPGAKGAFRILGFVLEKLGRNEEAEQAYRKAIELDSDLASTWSGLGSVLETLDRDEEAEEVYRKATELEPKNDWPWLRLALVLARLRRLKEAEEAHRRAIHLDPKDPCNWHYFGTLLSRTHRQKEAEEACKKSIDVDPEHAPAWRALGIVLAISGRIDESEGALRRATELDPEDTKAWNNLGKVLWRLKRTDEAKAAFRKTTALDPHNANAWDSLGHLVSSIGPAAEAEGIWAEALELHPSLTPCAVHLVEAHLEQGWPADALLREAEEWIGRSERTVGSLESMARFVLRSNLEDGLPQAESWAREAWSKEQTAETSGTLALVRAAQGEWAEALEASRLMLDSAVDSPERQEAVTGLTIRLAAAGQAQESHAAVASSKGAPALEPLLAGLRIYLGETPQVAKEILEIGRDVAERIREIEEKQKDHDRARTKASPNGKPRKAAKGRTGQRAKKSKSKANKGSGRTRGNKART